MPDHRKPKTENRKLPLRICVPVVEATTNRARSKYLRAARKGLWTELRLDYLEQPDLKRLFRTHPGPVIATNRLAAEGGNWRGSEADRRRLAGRGPGSGGRLSGPGAGRGRRLAPGAVGSAGARPKLSSPGTIFPAPLILNAWKTSYKKCWTQEADVIKMVALAQQPEDNLRLLSLIPQAKAAGREIIAFCMGPAGKWSRVAAPLLGSFLTFAPFTKKGASAPGQLTVNEVKRLWKMLKR